MRSRVLGDVEFWARDVIGYLYKEGGCFGALCPYQWQCSSVVGRCSLSAQVKAAIARGRELNRNSTVLSFALEYGGISVDISIPNYFGHIDFSTPI